MRANGTHVENAVEKRLVSWCLLWIGAVGAGHLGGARLRDSAFYPWPLALRRAVFRALWFAIGQQHITGRAP